MALLSGSAVVHAQLFQNLNSLVIQLPAGDPATPAFDGREGPKGIAVGDLDDDNNPDLVMANKDGTLTVYFGKGAAQFHPPVHVRTGAKTLRGVALKDLTGDTLPELICASPYEGVIFWFLNRGNRTFGEPAIIPAWPGVRNLAFGNFDGDATPDLVAAGTTNGVRQYRGLGGGAFTVATNLPALRGPDEVDLGDDDFPKPLFAIKVFRPAGSLRDEVAIAHTESEVTWILAPDSNGQLMITNMVLTGQTHGLDVGAIGQPVGSGLADLVVARRQANRIDIYGGVNTPERFSSMVRQSIPIEGEPRAVTIQDLDADGWNDLVVVLRRLDRVLTYRNSNGVLFASAEQPVGQSPREIVGADFDRDGYPDVAVLNRISSDATILVTYAGQVGFAGVNHMYLVDGGVVGLTVQDFNGDGRDDVLQLHQSSGDFSVRLAMTNGLLRPPVYYTIGNVPSSQVIVDVNNDGVIDQVTASLGGATSDEGSVSVRLGNINGTFGEERIYPLPPGKEGRLFSLLPADFDGDGNVDLAAGFLDSRLGFFVGLGDGSFAFTREHDLVAGAYALASGDFDSDGDLDLAGLGVSGELVILENRGDILTAPTLTLTSYPATDPSDSGARSLKTIDLNRDDDIDLLVGSGQGALLYHGGPGMAFYRQSPPLPGTGFPVSTTLESDFDSDGIDDLIVACRIISCLSVLTRNADGTFASALSVDVPANKFIATGDLDGDGLPDLVGTGRVLWTALSGHSPQRTPPLRLEGQRPYISAPVINEILAVNTLLPVDQDSGRFTDWVELFNGSLVSLPLAGWKVRLITPVNSDSFATNDYPLPPTAFLGSGRHLLILYSDRKRTLYHTGFKLPGGGGTLCLIDNAGVEIDRVIFAEQQENVSLARYRDGLASFVSNPYPTPGSSNPDNGPVAPITSFTGVEATTLVPGKKVRFLAQAADDVGLASVTLFYQRLDAPNLPVVRLPLFDDGWHEDGARGDGFYAGTLELGLPAGAELQFYLEVVDTDNETVLVPENPGFVLPGETLRALSLAVGVPVPPLEISEFIASNERGLRDEHGDIPDWIEIRNCSRDSVSLRGLSVSRQFAEKDVYLLPDQSLGPGEHLVFFADNEPQDGTNHAPFDLAKSGGQLWLTGQTPHGAKTLIDWVSFGPQTTDVSSARLGCGGPWRPTQPTPGSQNIHGAWTGLVHRTGDSVDFLFGFTTQTQRMYQVEYIDNLDASQWIALPPLAGDGIEKVIDQPLVPNRFYRVRLDP